MGKLQFITIRTEAKVRSLAFPVGPPLISPCPCVSVFRVWQNDFSFLRLFIEELL